MRAIPWPEMFCLHILGNVLSLINSPTCFALQYLCGQSNSLFTATKSLDPVSIYNSLVSQPGELL